MIKERSNRFVIVSAMGANLAFGIGMGVAFLGMEPFLTNVGSWLYLASTTILLGGIVLVFLTHSYCLPGDEVHTTLGFVGGLMFLVHVIGSLLTAVPSIIEPLGVGGNLVYSALATLVVLSTIVFLDTLPSPQR